MFGKLHSLALGKLIWYILIKTASFVLMTLCNNTVIISTNQYVQTVQNVTYFLCVFKRRLLYISKETVYL